MELKHVGFEVPDLPVSDLMRMREEIDAQISAKQTSEMALVAEQMQQLAAESGFAIRDLIPFLLENKLLPVKYRHPEKPELTWCGKGRRPLWLNEAIDAGIPLAKIRV